MKKVSVAIALMVITVIAITWKLIEKMINKEAV